MDEHAVACTLTLLHPGAPRARAGPVPVHARAGTPADVAIALFMAWLGLLPAWVLAWDSSPREDSRPAGALLPRVSVPGPALRRAPRRAAPGQLDDERRAALRLALHPDGPCERGDDLARDPQPDAEAGELVPAHSVLVPLEDARLVLGADPLAPVADGDPGSVALGLDAHHDGVAGAVLDGVGEEAS